MLFPMTSLSAFTVAHGGTQPIQMATRRCRSRLIQFPCATLRSMPRRVSQGGRPSKGARIAMISRVAPAVAEAVRNEAERLDLSYNDLIANILADRYGLPPVSKPAESDQMKLTA